MTITDEGIRIELPFNDYSKRRNSVKKECYMLLLENSIQYKIVAEYEDIDVDTEVWMEKKANWRWTRRRDMISDVSMYYDNKEAQWLVGLEFSGIAGSGNEWMCVGPREALAIYTTLQDYFITRPS